MRSLNDILRYDLCVGCGLCEAIDSQCHMALNTAGFYRPDPVPSDCRAVEKLWRVCPGVHVQSDSHVNTEAWGSVVSVCNAWAADSDIRHLASSGGVTSALAIYLLESEQVDGVLHVGVKQGDWLHNCLHVSRTREEVLSRAASRYAPALVLNELLSIIHPKERYCFIGKPCDVAAIRNLQREEPQRFGRITHCLAIFCAGMPNYEATRQALNTFGIDDEPVALRYRGDGWPGYFTATYRSGRMARMTYNESWGKILGRRLGFRCKICPDGIGLLADIASGDSWNTRDGYPDFTESEGRNFCFVRTEQGQHLFDEAVRAGYVVSEAIDVSQVKVMQAYQYQRRHLVGWRIGVVQLMTRGILKFKRLGYIQMAMKTNIPRALKDALGTAKRLSRVLRTTSGGGKISSIHVVRA